MLKIPTNTIRGKIIDQDSRIHVAGAVVYLIDSEKTTKQFISDTLGSFYFENVPIGLFTIQVRQISYEAKELTNLYLGSAKEFWLKIQLAEKITALDSVIIEGKRSLPKLGFASVKNIDFAHAKNYAAAFDDPGRIIQTLPGVIGTGDNGNNVSIRGNSPIGLLWRIEGVDVPTPNHFAFNGAAGGLIGMFGNNTIDNANFYSGAFPADFGNATAGVVDIELRRGNTKKREYGFELGMLGLRAEAEGPLKKGKEASYLFSYRLWDISLLKKAGVDFKEALIPSVQDFNFNIHLKTNNGSTNIWGIGGLGYRYQKYSIYYDQAWYNMGTAGIKNIININQRSFLQNVVSYSASQQKSNNSNSYLNSSNVRLNEYIQLNTRLSSMYQYKLNSKNTFNIGGVFRYINSNISSSSYSNFIMNTTNTVSSSIDAVILQAYIKWKYRITEKLTLLTGAHLLYLNYINKAALEPRISAEYRLSNKYQINMGAGKHSRSEDLISYSNYYFNNTNRELNLSVAYHFVLGQKFYFSNDWELSIDAYYQYLTKVLIDKYDSSPQTAINDDTYVPNSWANNGIGHNEGVELMISKTRPKNYFITLTGTVFNSKAKASDNVWRDTRYNSHFAFNFLAGKDFVKQKAEKQIIWSVNTRITYFGGPLIKTIDLFFSKKYGETVYANPYLYDTRNPNYFRADLQIRRKKEKTHYSTEWKLEIQNVTNMQNVSTQYYDPITRKILYNYQLPILPVISYRVEF